MLIEKGMDPDLKVIFLAGLETLNKARNRALAGQPLSPGEVLGLVRFADVLRNELNGYRPEPLGTPPPIPSPPRTAPAATPAEG